MRNACYTMPHVTPCRMLHHAACYTLLSDGVHLSKYGHGAIPPFHGYKYATNMKLAVILPPAVDYPSHTGKRTPHGGDRMEL
jgi:hypothetical protein